MNQYVASFCLIPWRRRGVKAHKTRMNAFVALSHIMANLVFENRSYLTTVLSNENW